jgi:hypothetical protein
MAIAKTVEIFASDFRSTMMLFSSTMFTNLKSGISLSFVDPWIAANESNATNDNLKVIHTKQT